ncbi:MAG: hypothetical protein CMB80_10725 [Flammeovirgaceae bacterium]|nr:hypothetical protein [Flammeovirgaceae bacterium]
MKIKIKWAFDWDVVSNEEDHDKFAADNGIPLNVEIPDASSDDYIKDVLRDLAGTYGWRVLDWKQEDVFRRANQQSCIV